MTRLGRPPASRFAPLVAGWLALVAGCSDRNPASGKVSTEESSAKSGVESGAESNRDPGPTASPDKLPSLPHEIFAGPGPALASILAHKPRVIGFGEYHELQSSAAVQSTIHRFTTEMLDLLAGQASDLVVETWVEAGRCGAEEKRVSQDVKQVTERPQHTQNELVTMIQRAQKLAIRPHLLELRCEDYQSILRPAAAAGPPAAPTNGGPPATPTSGGPPATPNSGGQEVDYEKLLQLVAAKLRDQALASLEQSGADRMVVLYGGSLHNELHPVPGVEDFSYAPAVDKAASGGYIEVDLLVPEYIDADPDLAKESWYPLYRRLSGADRVVLIERAPRSYVLILRRELARATPPRPPQPPTGG